MRLKREAWVSVILYILDGVLEQSWVCCWAVKCQVAISTQQSQLHWPPLASFLGGRFLITWQLNILEHSWPLPVFSLSTGKPWSGMSMIVEDTESLRTQLPSLEPIQVIISPFKVASWTRWLELLCYYSVFAQSLTKTIWRLILNKSLPFSFSISAFPGQQANDSLLCRSDHPCYWSMLWIQLRICHQSCSGLCSQTVHMWEMFPTYFVIDSCVSVLSGWGFDVFTYSYHWWVIPIFATHIGAILGAWIYYLAIGNITSLKL